MESFSSSDVKLLSGNSDRAKTLDGIKCCERATNRSAKSDVGESRLIHLNYLVSFNIGITITSNILLIHLKFTSV